MIPTNDMLDEPIERRTVAYVPTPMVRFTASLVP